MTVGFQLEGQDFVALNGGPVFNFNPAISFQVHCESQEELDHYWEALAAGGDKEAQRCGWLKDRYGVSWQIIPTTLAELLQNPDAEKSQRVMQALLQMDKLDLRRLQQAYEGKLG
jgi:predicted 3-demethylubiquinone-9 3-methyltransferase (glyoxalase superfamily)